MVTLVLLGNFIGTNFNSSGWASFDDFYKDFDELAQVPSWMPSSEISAVSENS